MMKKKFTAKYNYESEFERLNRAAEEQTKRRRRETKKASWG